VNSLVDMLRPYGIIEMVRNGLVAMVRGSGYWSGMPPENGNGSPVETEPDIVSLGM